MLKILFFGKLGDLAGCESCQLAGSPAMTAAALRDNLGAENPALGAALNQPQVMVAINQSLVPWDTVLTDGDEIAFLPPVTGG